MPIFDQGYQHWEGTLSGHGWRWLAVARHGVRAQLKNRFVRLMLLVAWLPALGLVTALTLWGLIEQRAESIISLVQRLLPPDLIAQPKEFRSAFWTIAYSFFFKAELICSLFLVLVVGPNLISRDLRFNALPLYLSRPVRRFDYFAGKLGVIGYFLAATVVIPAIGAYLLGLAFSLDLSVIRDTHRLIWSGLLYGLIITASAGTLMLALSSLSRRSIYVGLAWAGFVFLTHMLSSALVGIHGDDSRQKIVQEGLQTWIRDHPPPQGVEMSGLYPRNRYIAPARPLGGVIPAVNADVRARDKWMESWSLVYNRLNTEAQSSRIVASSTDWRPVLSYGTNLDRMGDWLLDTDSAWVLLGRTIERPRAALGPLARGGGVPVPAGPANDRMLADRMSLQYPWYWSAGTLAGLGLFSMVVLARRVKSLDRLK